MHRVLWRVHRVSLQAIKVGKVMTAEFGLTPSRFHMLSAIACEQEDWFPQRALRELLGITAQTISRMVHSLIDCGFLVQRVVQGDRRRRELAFTGSGREIFRRAFGKIVEGSLASHVVGRALTDLAWPTTKMARAQAIDEFECVMHRLRYGLRDDALFEYAPENQQPSPVYRGFDLEGLSYVDSTPDLFELDEDSRRGAAWVPSPSRDGTPVSASE
jgi:DNA-binding MarR family transcriptional regulator